MDKWFLTWHFHSPGKSNRKERAGRPGKPPQQGLAMGRLFAPSPPVPYLFCTEADIHFIEVGQPLVNDQLTACEVKKHFHNF